MGNTSSAQKINFEDVQYASKNTNVSIISTLPVSKQECLIYNTMAPTQEIETINRWMQSPQTAPLIIIYGENSCDDSVIKKYLQLIKLGFKNVAIYQGGLFEWLLLQDIYGEELFPTRGIAKDMLLYKGVSKKPS